METHKPKTELDKLLDEALMATFPCSDPFNFQTMEEEPPPGDFERKGQGGALRKNTGQPQSLSTAVRSTGNILRSSACFDW